MGGERSSRVRQRLSGRICAICSNSLSAPHAPGERLCTGCAAGREPRHRVYMYFMLRDGWHCQFLEPDLKTPLPRKLTFSTPPRILELAERGGYCMNLEGRQALDHGFENGRGGIRLLLTEDQYQKLKGCG